MTEAGQRLIAAAKEARAVARGEAKPYRVHYPITTERLAGAPATIGEHDALQTQRPKVD